MTEESQDTILLEEAQGVSSPIAELPLVTVILTTFNCSQIIPITIESILNQNYTAIDLVIVDAGSTDKTLEVLRHYHDPRIQLTSLEENQVYKMINKGISLAKGEYINVLFPGDYYIHRHVLYDMMQLATREDKPDLVYCGTLLRDGKSEVKFLFRPLTLDLLRRGQQPTSLQGCWFKKDIFQEIGTFSTALELRGGFDLLCRFCLHKKYRFASLRHALSDYDLRWVTSKMVIRHFWETFQIVYHYFGLWTLLKWLVRQKDVGRFVKLMVRHLSVALFGR